MLDDDPRLRQGSSGRLIAAGMVIAAIPSTIVFLLFQRSFVVGPALGAVK